MNAKATIHVLTKTLPDQYTPTIWRKIPRSIYIAGTKLGSPLFYGKICANLLSSSLVTQGYVTAFERADSANANGSGSDSGSGSGSGSDRGSINAFYQRAPTF